MPVLGDAFDGVTFVEAVLDGADEPVGLGVDAGEFGVDGGDFGLVGVAHAFDGRGHGGDGFVDQVGAPVGVHQGAEDCLLNLVCG
ncbi:MAG: hypothetical protein AUI14_13855 [Actinobacteria bacterium 13_2_20CM_2_71_6]|nr:MAG: hypothetical protein AUI14_13855 [Actinobacteria bacterium 13_2_20CM_2_71_6]